MPDINKQQSVIKTITKTVDDYKIENKPDWEIGALIMELKRLKKEGAINIYFSTDIHHESAVLEIYVS